MSLYRQMLDLHTKRCRMCARKDWCSVVVDLRLRAFEEAVAEVEYIPLPVWNAPGWHSIAIAAAGQPPEGA